MADDVVAVVAESAEKQDTAEETKNTDRKSRTQPIRFKPEQNTLEAKKDAIAQKIRELQNYRRTLIRNDNANKLEIPKRKKDTARLCALGRLVERLENKEIPHEDLDNFKETYIKMQAALTAPVVLPAHCARWQKIGKIVENAAHREIKDFEAFQRWMEQQQQRGFLQG